MEAVVQIGDVETPILRCGRGQETILLIAGDEAERRSAAGRLGRIARVIAPAACGDGCAPGQNTAHCLGLALCRGVCDGAAGHVCECAHRLVCVIEGLGVVITLVAATLDAQQVAARTAALLDVPCVSVKSLDDTVVAAG